MNDAEQEVCKLITNNKETELVQEEGVGNNYKVITDNEGTELRHRFYNATVEEEIEREEERGKTKCKHKEMTAFGGI